MIMKTIRACSIVAILLIAFIACEDTVVVTDAFLTDLGSENSRLASNLFLDVFKGPLDTLTFQFYLSYVQQEQATSAKDLADRLRLANVYVLQGKGDLFLLGLRYDRERKIVLDNSRTTKYDSLVTWNEGEPAPRVEDLVAKMKE